MANTVLANRIKEKIDKLDIVDNSIIVLKGIPLQVVDTNTGKIDLGKIIENKMSYLMSIYGNRKIITYEEFLLLTDFIVAQYKEIYILNNNVYMEQFPVEECFSEKVRAGLLNHYGESEQEENDDSEIGDIDEYIAIFEGLKEYNGYLMGAYSKSPILSNNKIITINLFDSNQDALIYQENIDDGFIDLIEESDYIDFIKLLFAEPDEICVRISNYTGDLNRLKNHISMVASYWKDYTDIFLIQAQNIENEFEHREEYSLILKKYWGYSSYRNLSVYDMNKLEQGEKEVIEVSKYIFFTDEVLVNSNGSIKAQSCKTQLETFSPHIADLLVRCCVQIEAISKELYFDNGGSKARGDSTIHFDEDCLKLIDIKWQTHNKIVMVVAPYFNLTKDENRFLNPLIESHKRQ